MASVTSSRRVGCQRGVDVERGAAVMGCWDLGFGVWVVRDERVSAVDVYLYSGGNVSLATLRTLPAFLQFEAELGSAVRSLSKPARG
jgi:uncharacterized protein with GYD domain